MRRGACVLSRGLHPTWAATSVITHVDPFLLAVAVAAVAWPPHLQLQSLQALVTEVQAKTAALLEAERRFAELEGVMQRIVARSS